MPGTADDATRYGAISGADFDFGLTALGAGFHQDWIHRADTPLDLVRVHCGYGSPRVGVSLLMQDVMRLLLSPLSGADLAGLWLACADFDHPRGVFGIDGRTWLWQVAGVCRPVLAELGIFAWWALPDCRHPCFDVVVAEWAGGLQLPEGSLSRSWVMGFGARWQVVAEQVCAELAARILMRALAHTGVRIPPEIFARILRQSERFGHGEALIINIEGQVG